MYSTTILTSRNLTIHGRVTVLNSLILSKLWQALRLVTFTPSELDNIKSIISSFVNRNSKLACLSFDTLTLSRSQGGLKLLNPTQQANALQWRWLQPFLHPNQPSPPLMPSLPIFPPLSVSLLPLVTPLPSIPNFNCCFVDTPTIQRLPFISLPPSNPFASTFSPPSTVLCNNVTIRLHLYGSHIFDYNPTTLTLTLKQTFHNLPYPTSSARATNMIRSRTLLNLFTFQAINPQALRPLITNTHIDIHNPPTMVSLHFLLKSIVSCHLDLQSFQFQIAPPSTKGFKSLPPSSPLPTPRTIMSPSQWKTFWALRIPLNARNTWYRFLHGKIVTRELLQSRLSLPPDPVCAICKFSTETTEHFLFACPLKRSFWSAAFSKYMPSSISQNSYSNFRKFLLLEHPLSRHQQHSIYPDLSVHQVFSGMLQTVWCYHYQHHFHHTPFIPSALLLYLHKSLTTLHS
ncbi:hypothetical protein MAM1_0976c11394, partial [Mucor ambiguus]